MNGFGTREIVCPGSWDVPVVVAVLILLLLLVPAAYCGSVCLFPAQLLVFWADLGVFVLLVMLVDALVAVITTANHHFLGALGIVLGLLWRVSWYGISYVMVVFFLVFSVFLRAPLLGSFSRSMIHTLF